MGKRVSLMRVVKVSRADSANAGLVSAIAFSPDTSSGLFAVGTFKGGRIGCYSEDTGDERIMELDLGNGGQKVDGQGITQVRCEHLRLVTGSVSDTMTSSPSTL